MAVRVVVWHLGALHPFEQVLTLLLAFGPFVILAVVLAFRRRSEAGEANDDGPVEPDVEQGVDRSIDEDDG